MGYGWRMSYQLQVKGVTDEIKERLAASAERNFRSVNQEALARIQFSFEMEDSLRSKTLQKMIDEGLAGSSRPGRMAEALELIIGQPEIGRRRKDLQQPALRSFRVTGFDSYLIFYQLRKNEIFFIRLLHGAMDLPAMFPEA